MRKPEPLSQKPDQLLFRDAQLVLRRMTPADISDVLQLEQETPGAPHWSRDQYEASTLNSSEAVRRRAWVALHSGQLVAFAVVRELATGPEIECELESLVVHPLTQQKGIGARLLKHVLSELKAASASLLLLEVRASNLAARHLYQRMGLAEKDVRKNYYPAESGGTAEDAILMELRFPGSRGT
jgi:[ribosomal protein S18]-alanine N-acetyltransferase